MTKIATRIELLQQYSKIYSKRNVRILGMYNSILDMLIRDQDLMMVPFDDRIMNRAHGVMETGNLRNFRFSNLKNHLIRLQSSASIAGIKMPMENQIIQQKMNDLAKLAYETLYQEKMQKLNELIMQFKIILSSGNGDFGIFSYGKQSTLYAAIYLQDQNLLINEMKNGVKEFTNKEIWTNPYYFANAKTVNYLAPAISADFSKKNGGYVGIRFDEKGNILEGTITNIGFVLKDNSFAYPSMKKTIQGTTLRNVLEIVKSKLLPIGKISSIQEIELKLSDVSHKVKEMFHLSNEKVIPIVELDGKKIGDGKVGEIAQYLQQNIRVQQLEGGELIEGIDQIKCQQ